jgi:hypothetical protein
MMQILVLGYANAVSYLHQYAPSDALFCPDAWVGQFHQARFTTCPHATGGRKKRKSKSKSKSKSKTW